MRGAALGATLLVVAGLVTAAHGLCRPGHTWWSPHRDTCLDCTRCDKLEPPLLVLRPCQLHQDALCASLGDLHIDWSWLRDYKRKPQHKKKHEHLEHVQRKNETKDNRRIIWRFSTLSGEETQDRSEEKYPKPESEVTNDKLDQTSSSVEDNSFAETVEDYSDYDSEVEVELGSEPFLSEGDLIWDWQTIVLTLAAFTCVLFFIVVAAYSVHHAKQWRLMKKNLEAGKLNHAILYFLFSFFSF